MLLKSLSHQTGFKVFHRTISKPFNLVNPLVVDDMSMWRAWTEGPSVVGDKGLKFSSHGCLPPRISGSLAIAGGFKVREGRMKGKK